MFGDLCFKLSYIEASIIHFAWDDFVTLARLG